MRRQKLTIYSVNGWEIEKRPNTFAEHYLWVATAVDAEGYETARVGFQSLRAARAYCEATPAPTTPKAVSPAVLAARAAIASL